MTIRMDAKSFGFFSCMNCAWDNFRRTKEEDGIRFYRQMEAADTNEAVSFLVHYTRSVYGFWSCEFVEGRNHLLNCTNSVAASQQKAEIVLRYFKSLGFQPYQNTPVIGTPFEKPIIRDEAAPYKPLRDYAVICSIRSEDLIVAFGVLSIAGSVGFIGSTLIPAIAAASKEEPEKLEAVDFPEATDFPESTDFPEEPKIEVKKASQVFRNNARNHFLSSSNPEVMNCRGASLLPNSTASDPKPHPLQRTTRSEPAFFVKHKHKDKDKKKLDTKAYMSAVNDHSSKKVKKAGNAVKETVLSFSYFVAQDYESAAEHAVEAAKNVADNLFDPGPDHNDYMRSP